MTTGEGGPRTGGQVEPPVDPRTAADSAELAEALTQLRSRAGMTIREVSRATGIPSATLGGWFSGRHLPPASQKAQYAAVLEALGLDATQAQLWWAELTRVRRSGAGRTVGRPGNGLVPYRGLGSYGIEDAEWFLGREELSAALVDTVETLLRRDTGPGLVTVVGASGSGKSSLLSAGVAATLLASSVGVAVLAPGADPVAELARAVESLEGHPRRVVVVDQLEELFAVDPVQRRDVLARMQRLASEPATVVVSALRADFFGAAVEEPLMVPLLEAPQVLLGPLTEAALQRVVTEPAARVGCAVEPGLVELLLRDLLPPGRPAEASTLPLLSHALLATWTRAGGGRLTAADYLAVGGVAGAVQRSAEEVYEHLGPAERQTARRLFAQLVNVDEEGPATRRRLRHEDLDDRHLREVAERFVAARILTMTDDTVEISHEILLTAWPRLTGWLEDDRESLLVRRRLSRAARDWESSGHDPAALLRGAQLERARELSTAGPGSGLTVLERGYLTASVQRAAAEEQAEERRLRRTRVGVGVVVVLGLLTSVLSAYLLRANQEAEQLQTAVETSRDAARSRQAAVRAEQLGESEPSLGAQLALAAYELAPTVEARSALLDATGAPQVTRLTGPPGPMRALGSPDGLLLVTAGADGTVRLWTRETPGVTPEQVETVEVGGELFAAAFSPDGRLVAVGGTDGTVHVLDVSDPQAPVAWTPADDPDGTVLDLAFAADGRTLVAATSDPAVRRWRLGDKELVPLPALTDVAGTVQAVATAPDGTVAVGGVEGAVGLYRPAGGVWTPVRELALDGAPVVRALAFSPDGRLVAAGASDKLVRVWDTRTGLPVTRPLTGFSSWVNAVAFSSDGGRLAAGASGGRVVVWGTEQWQRQRTQPGPANYTSVQFLADDTELLTGGIDGTAHVITLDGPRLPPAADNIWGLSTPSAGTVTYVGVGSAAPQVLRVDTSDPLAPRVAGELTAPDGAGTLDGVVAVSPAGDLLVAGTSDGRLVVWRDPASSAEVVTVLEAADDLVENVAFSADGSRFAASSDDGSAVVYDVDGTDEPTRLTSVDTHSLALGVALSPDGSVLAVGTGDDHVHLWSLDDAAADDDDGGGPESVELQGFESYVYGLAYSADGAWLAAGSADGTVRVWDVTDPSDPTPAGPPLRGPSDTVFSVAFDDTATLLAAASQDGQVWLWDWDSGQGSTYARLDGLGGGLHQVLVHPTDEVVMAAGADGLAGSWSTDVEHAREWVCRTSGSPITETEWEQYLPGVPFDPPC